jgi:hypothetical protein
VTSYYGKYRGKVELNIDPMQQGRVQVSCPAVLGDGRMSWAMPNAPSDGFFMIPANGASVWVEFEGGDPDKPIWSGCFWETGKAPAQPALPQMKVIKTDSVTITMSDLPGAGGLTIEVSPPAVATPLKIALSASGIELTNGSASVKLTPASVSLNNGALEVI